jgi:hypothetical protein
MYKLLGGANILRKHQIAVYSKNITDSTMGRGYFFLFKYLGYNV